jgi:phospholipid transport system substrate-binding protein
MPCFPYAFPIQVIACFALLAEWQGVAIAKTLATQPTTAATQVSAAGTPRQAMEETISEVLGLLKDKSLSRIQRAEGLDAILRRRMDFATLSRLMLGRNWDELNETQQKAFIEELSQHLMGVYLPMTDGYSGQKVQVTEERPEPNGDHTVQAAINDVRGGAVNQVATLACRMRRGEEGWKAIDMRVEGISVAVLFRAQFRPVMVRDGFDALLQRLREKNAQSKSTRVKG